jgi:hypothetical protein
MMCEEISKKQKNKSTIKGIVKDWKNCDDIWIFYVKNVFLRTEHENLTSEKLKVVACDSQMKSLYNETKMNKKDFNNDNDLN